MQDHILRNVRLLCDNFVDDDEPREWSLPKNLSEWINYTVFDIISDLCFGRNLNLIGCDENRDVLKTFEAGMRALRIVRTLPLYANQSVAHELIWF